MNIFLESYIETALWSSMDESNERGGEPMDKNYARRDISPEAIKRMTEDCSEFEKLIVDLDPKHAGHNFWLTRNHRGAGFWDGGYPEDTGKRLTDAAHSFGECNLYVGDDGLIYTS
jgi:hypothetical protein